MDMKALMMIEIKVKTMDSQTNNLGISNQELEGDLRQNLNVDDQSVRHRAQSNAQRIRTLLDYLGTYFQELGRVMMQVQMGENVDEGSRLLPTAHRLINSGLVGAFVKCGEESGEQCGKDGNDVAVGSVGNGGNAAGKLGK
ncbi:hypothetical protein HAX54_013823 [Datura stramonium]|uniref:Uncharacterized protein n=1 Tax=Datura stramonium TaxID=4076 RepID=A0ABS8TMX5_DATST|nr:hypothetical protein [Datura stramonium]